MSSSQDKQKIYKIYFIIQKKVYYGDAIYVSGNIPQLGNWNLHDSLRLTWNKDHYWTGFLTVQNPIVGSIIEFKYVMGQWRDPSQGEITWQIGKSNRKIQVQTDRHHIICDNVWNKEKITLNLFVNPLQNNQQYYVVGNCTQLGSWTTPKKLKQTEFTQNTINKARIKNNSVSIMDCYQISILVPRGMKKINYLYIKKSRSIEVERNPGRMFELESNKSSHPKCFEVKNNSGDSQIFQLCNFNELNYSKVSDQIYLGAYIQDNEDLKKLKSEGVTSIISIQTEQDFDSHNISLEYIEKICELSHIRHFRIDIEDMNRKDFVNKAASAITLMKQQIKKGQKIYIHCSAGVYRSSQLVVLYLILTQNLSINEAIQKVKSKHPFARPNPNTIKDSLLQITTRWSRIKSF